MSQCSQNETVAVPSCNLFLSRSGVFVNPVSSSGVCAKAQCVTKGKLSMLCLIGVIAYLIP
eukprot:m.175177 g.175177  ORF g.175177 m.175177 type:complete len:61 (-) comp14606_c0_seq8:2024-2206(-)